MTVTLNIVLECSRLKRILLQEVPTESTNVVLLKVEQISDIRTLLQVREVRTWMAIQEPHVLVVQPEKR